MGWKPGDIHKRSKAYPLLGRRLEEKVSIVLARMKGAGEISDFIRHAPHLVEDKSGIDFTVKVGEKEISFDVTISSRLDRKRKSRPNIPHLSFPVGTADMTIRKGVMDLVSTVR